MIVYAVERATSEEPELIVLFTERKLAEDLIASRQPDAYNTHYNVVEYPLLDAPPVLIHVYSCTGTIDLDTLKVGMLYSEGDVWNYQCVNQDLVTNSVVQDVGLGYPFATRYIMVRGTAHMAVVEECHRVVAEQLELLHNEQTNVD